MKKLVDTKNSGPAKEFLKTYRQPYRTTAQEIVMSQVYNAYTPKTYKRTWKLFKAVKIVSEDNRHFAIAISLTSDLEMDTPNNRHRYYPILVILGITSKYPVEGYPKRNWYTGPDGWVLTFKGKFASDFHAYILGLLRNAK